jgi:D-alanyl-D-alanine carboxypeptidase
MVVLASQPAMAATYAAMVMDARDGSVLHAENAEQRLHPA